MRTDTSYRSVVYILPGTEVIIPSDLAAAQHLALERKLPFAVIAIIPEADYTEAAFDDLEKLERILGAFHIPLMVCIGSEASVRTALTHHLNPYICNPDRFHAGATLQVHPYRWSGHVQPVAQVRHYAHQVASGETRLCI